ncbi:glucagon-like peptide 2 receptor [Engraulis encrasicolus]|uniref:glucagon-like peptide 2 receptor n=1 Tax=Engraulis encrasicolus TaxID=184585 RepID=UPI002FCEA010
MASAVDAIISLRTDYWKKCNESLSTQIPTETGVFCNGTFDKFVCWPHSLPGNVSVSCPSYLPWISSDGSRKVHGECLPSGKWRTEDNSSLVWREITQCEEPGFYATDDDELARHYVLTTTTIVGYSLSLASLIIAVIIMGNLRKLHCTRNYIHLNLFVSFILRAMATIAHTLVSTTRASNLPIDEMGWNTYSNSTIAVICKASRVSMEYFVGCNFFWLLVEAIFLHTLLFTAVLTKRRLLKQYMLIGWGTPMAFILPWIVIKAQYENIYCWVNSSGLIWWIIKGPIALAVTVIFCIFLKILRLLLSKLKADQVKFTDYRYSLARATLVLIPLLGIHEVVFNLATDDIMDRKQRYVRNFINMILSSSQGFVVAVLYCFLNGEVRAELKKRWQEYACAQRVDVRGCFRGMHPKYLWQCSRRPAASSSQSCADHHHHSHSHSNSDPCPYQDGGGAQTHTHLLQVPTQGGRGVGSQPQWAGRATALEFYPRKSLSSSDGEMTMGETMEEILEESEF